MPTSHQKMHVLGICA